MTKTHWKRLVNPDYLGAYSLDPGQDKVLTIKTVRREMVTGAEGKKEECTVAHFVEREKPMILNRTNMKTIQKVYKTPFIEEWAGRKIQLFSADVKAFGETVDALRIRPYIPTQAEAAPTCTDCAKPIRAVGKRTADDIAKSTYAKYGKSLCADCGKAEAERIEVAAQGADPLSEGGKENATDR